MSRQVHDIVLRPGDFWFGGGDLRVRTLLGSCVAIVMWHPQQRLGGMCHYVMPDRRFVNPASVPMTEAYDGHYADGALRLFQRELQRHRLQADAMRVKVFGGSRTLQLGGSRRTAAVGPKNVDSARNLLESAGFSVQVCHCGGAGHRKLVFDINSGDVWLKRGTWRAETTASS